MSARHVVAFPNRYYDSVKLMRVSVELESLPGIHAASAVMATPMNVELLRAQGFEGQALDAGAETLVVAIAGAGDHDVERAFDRLDELLSSSVAIPGDTTAGPPRSLEAALRLHPQANLVVVAVPGQHAALEAWTALRAGRNVFLFSDNVSLSDEVKLKQAAASLGLVVMGPDCGTAMLGGIGLGFANRVRAGSIGLVGASGTGIQQVSSLIHQAGGGIAAAIGTGSRDLSTEVGGLMTLAGLEMLVADPAVERIGLISKPADPDVGSRVLERLSGSGKPAVACMLGAQPTTAGSMDNLNLQRAETLTEAADLLMGREPRKRRFEPRAPGHGEPRRRTGRLAALFAGGTLCQEAERIVRALAPAAEATFVDVGADEYTRGRAHPMIDPRLRADMIERSGDEADVLLFDVVLGDLAYPDPAGALIPPVEAARVRALARGVDLAVYASLIGTDLDPQGLGRQRSMLTDIGVMVSSSNAEVAELAGRCLTGTPL